MTKNGNNECHMWPVHGHRWCEDNSGVPFLTIPGRNTSQIFCRFWDIDEKVGDFSEALISYSFSELLPNSFFKFSALSSSLIRFSQIFK